MVEKVTYGPWLIDHGLRWKDGSCTAWSCSDVIRRYFTFPENGTKIRFYVTNKPAPDNYKFSLAGDYCIKIRSVTMRLYPRLYYFLREALLDNGQHYFGLEYL